MKIYYSVKELAEKLHRSKSSVWRSIRRGRIKVVLEDFGKSKFIHFREYQRIVRELKKK